MIRVDHGQQVICQQIMLDRRFQLKIQLMAWYFTRQREDIGYLMRKK